MDGIKGSEHKAVRHRNWSRNRPLGPVRRVVGISAVLFFGLCCSPIPTLAILWREERLQIGCFHMEKYSFNKETEIFINVTMHMYLCIYVAKSQFKILLIQICLSCICSVPGAQLSFTLEPDIGLCNTHDDVHVSHHCRCHVKCTD